MAVNTDLHKRIWSHRITMAQYRIFADGARVEPVVQYSLDNGASWHSSSEYPKVRDFCADAQAGLLVMKILNPSADDLDGVRMILQVCKSQVADVKNGKMKSGERHGALAAYHSIEVVANKYLDNIIQTRKDAEQTEPHVAEAATAVE